MLICLTQKLALTSPKTGGSSVGIVRSRTKATYLLLLESKEILAFHKTIKLNTVFRLCCHSLRGPKQAECCCSYGGCSSVRPGFANISSQILEIVVSFGVFNYEIKSFRCFVYNSCNDRLVLKLHWVFAVGLQLFCLQKMREEISSGLSAGK
jgi:hypothetical protein